MSKELEQFVADLLGRINAAEVYGKQQAESSSNSWDKGTHLMWSSRWEVAGDLVHELAEKYGVTILRCIVS